MNLLGNIVWLLLGGLAVAVEYFVSGLALCLTIVGIPFGIQALKLGLLGAAAGPASAQPAAAA